MRRIALATALLISHPVLAQKEWTPAPVPSVGPNNSVAPADRAGRASGPDRSAPFSDIPSGAAASGGQTSTSNGAGVGTPSVSR